MATRYRRMGFLRRRGRRGERQGLPPESLERRAVLAVTPVVVGSELTIAIDSSDRLDTAYVRGSDGFIEVSTSRSFADPFRVADTAIAAVTVSGAGGAQGLILASGTIDASLAVDGVERIAFLQGAALSGDVGGRLPGGTLSVADPASTGGRIDLVAARIDLAGTVRAAEGPGCRGRTGRSRRVRCRPGPASA